MKRLRPFQSRACKVALLFALPILPLWVLAARRSWLPRSLVVLARGAGGDYPCVTELSWAPNARTLAVGVQLKPGRGEIQLWDVRRGQRLRTISTPECQNLSWSSDGRTLLSSLPYETRFSSVSAWDPRTGAHQKRVPVFAPDERFTRAYVWLSDNDELQSYREGARQLQVRVSAWPSLQVRDSYTLPITHRNLAEDSILWSPEWSGAKRAATPSGSSSKTRFVVRDDARFITMYARENGQTRKLWRVRETANKADVVNNMFFSKSGTRLYTATWISSASGNDGVVSALNTQNGKILWQLKRPGEVQLIDVTRDDRILLQDRGDDITLRDTRDGRLLRSMKRPSQTQQTTFAAESFSPDSSTLAVASDDGTVTLWRVR